MKAATASRTAALALVVGVLPASAGGSPTEVIAVGAGHHWIRVHFRGAAGDAMYVPGRNVRALGGYVRLFPLFCGRSCGPPGALLRYYPASGALCFDGPPKSACRAAPPAAQRLLARAARLPRLRRAPTRAVRLTIAGRLVRVDVLRSAVELAILRGGRPAARPRLPLRAVVAWRGPDARDRPTRIAFTRSGIYASGLLYPLPSGVWTFACSQARPGRPAC